MHRKRGRGGRTHAHGERRSLIGRAADRDGDRHRYLHGSFGRAGRVGIERDARRAAARRGLHGLARIAAAKIGNARLVGVPRQLHGLLIGHIALFRHVLVDRRGDGGGAACRQARRRGAQLDLICVCDLDGVAGCPDDNVGGILDRRGDRGRPGGGAGHGAVFRDRRDRRVAAGIGELIASRRALCGRIHGSFALLDRQLLLFKGHGMVFRRLDSHSDLRRCGLAAAERDRSRAGLHCRQRDRAAAGRSVDRSWDRHDALVGRPDRQHVASCRARERHGQGSSLRVVSIDLNGRRIGRDRSHAQLHSDLDAAERLRFSVLCHHRRNGGGTDLQCLDRRAVNNADDIGMVTGERYACHSVSVRIRDADRRRVADLQRGISRCD